MDDRADRLLRAYEQCFAEKHHYDNLSWTIGAGLTVILGALVTGILHMRPDDLASRLLLAGFAVLLIVLWATIYRRNRFWGEVANETARDIEKTLQFDGIGHALMRGALDKRIVLKNTDYTGQRYADRKPWEESSPSWAMHTGINWILVCSAILVVVLAILPTTLLPG
jgi:hypothetical protein